MNSDRRMMRPSAVVGLASCVALGLLSVTASAQPGQGRGFAGFGQGGGIPFAESNDPRVDNRSYQFEATDEDLPYCVFASSKATEDTPAPLIISLHGLGIGPGFMCQGAAIDLAEEGGYILAAPLGYSVGGWYGSPVISMAGRGRGRGGEAPADAPDGPDPEDVARWSEQDVLNVLAMIRDEFNVDDDRTYLMGHSMGGAGTFFLGSKHASEWAAIAPIAPAAMMMNDNRATILQEIKDSNVPIYLVVGTEDSLISTAQLWADTMEELDMAHEYVELEGEDHGSVIDAGMAAIFEFFAKHTK